MTTSEILEKVGLEAICSKIENGHSQAEIARALKVDAGDLSRWLNRPENIQRSANARIGSAEAWLDRGLDTIASALDKQGGIDASAAKAYAQECARRAALRNPAYRDKSAVEHSGTLGIKNVTDLTDEELAAIATKGGD